MYLIFILDLKEGEITEFFFLVNTCAAFHHHLVYVPFV